MIDHRLPRRWPSALAERIVRSRWPCVLFALAIWAIAYPASRRLEFNRSIGAMFAPSDPTFVEYQELHASFGGDSVVILVYEDRALTTDDGLQRNRVIAQQVAEIEGVQGVLSPSLLNDAIERFQPPSLFTSKPNIFRADDPVAQGFDKLFTGYTHSQDHSRAAVVAMLAPDHPPQTVQQLDELARDLSRRFPSSSDGTPWVTDAVIVGEPVLVHDGFTLIQRDGARLATLTVVLLSIVVVVSLADARFVLLTAILIAWSVIVTKAIMVWIGVNLSLVSTILTAIVTVIAVTAVLHLGVRFRVARSRGYSAQQAATGAMSLLLLPIFWTCLTDAAGFAALNGSRILPIRQFGTMIAVAALAVCLAVILFAPAVMMLPGLGLGSRWQRLQNSLSRQLRRICLRVANGSIRHPGWCAAVGVVSVLIALLGVGKAEVETSFLNNFRAGSPVVRAYAGVETQFGGAGVWDVVLDAPSELTTQYLEQVRRLETDLRKLDVNGARLTKVLSLADADEILSKAPLSHLFSSSSRLSAMYLVMPAFFDALVTRPQPKSNAESTGRQLRIMLRSREQLNSEQKTALIEAVRQTVDDHVSSDSWAASVDKSNPGRVTGYYVLMARLVGQLIGDQWRCFLASALLVWCLLCLATGSIRLATASLIPNLLPIVLVLALVGLGGGKINMGAAMIAAVSIGLSIDGSVHFLAGYRRHRNRGHGSRAAATHAAGNMGVPVILATIALVVGFGAMSTSDFIPTATFGTLVAATLALGTAVNLTLLPATVVSVQRLTRSRSSDGSPIG